MKTTPSKKLTIGEIRSAIRSANYARTDYCYGGTTDEYLRCNVPFVLVPHIEKLSALLPGIAVRFAAEIEQCQSEIDRARKMIEDWTGRQTAETIAYRAQIAAQRAKIEEEGRAREMANHAHNESQPSHLRLVMPPRQFS